MFTATSRYAAIETAEIEGPDGTPIVYVRRRFVPAMPDNTTIAEHVVSDGERLDNVTARYLGDPEQFWRLCDANTAKRPNELTERIGRRLRIPLPR
jgi:hypothetical protein